MTREKEPNSLDNTIQKLDPILDTFLAYEESAKSYLAVMPPHFDEFIALLAPSSSIVELGCATGEIAEELRCREHNIIATDINPAMVSEAKSRHPELNVSVMDMNDIAEYIAPNSLDAVVVSFAFFHVLKSKAPKAMNNIANVLKPGGWAYFALQGIDGDAEISRESWSQHPSETKPVYIHSTSLAYRKRYLYAPARLSVRKSYTVETTEDQHDYPKHEDFVQKLSK
ncbi:MAG TPA: class I SAM-dependent methyltransferase [Candidatus Saccharimonadales bacterium]|nr:class I SAM-dependent methyltransferase [Candidatus Saccharimonadales bacterium]